MAPLSPEAEKRIAAAYLAGATIAGAGAAEGVSAERARSALRRQGVRLRSAGEARIGTRKSRPPRGSLAHRVLAALAGQPAGMAAAELLGPCAGDAAHRMPRTQALAWLGQTLRRCEEQGRVERVGTRVAPGRGPAGIAYRITASGADVLAALDALPEELNLKRRGDRAARRPWEAEAVRRYIAGEPTAALKAAYGYDVLRVIRVSGAPMRRRGSAPRAAPAREEAAPLPAAPPRARPLPPGPGIKRRLREALEAAPDGLTVPEAAALLGLPRTRHAGLRGAFLDGIREGWSERSGYRRGGQNVPSVVYRAAIELRRRCVDCGYEIGAEGHRIECGRA